MSAEPPRNEEPGVAFRRVYDSHVRLVWRTLLRLGVHTSDVSDAVQDVFVVVHRKLPEFENRAKLTTWLFTICARVASDRRQLAHARCEVPSSELSPSSDEAAPDAGVLLDRRRAYALIDGILRQIPDEQRTAFVLFELEGMSGEEISELLGVPVGTVRSRLRLARAAFEKALARWHACGDRTRLPSLLRTRQA